MFKKLKNGFTLIELLIVIAIIGILASIVLISLSSSRESALVASYKTTVVSLRTNLEICAGTGGGTLHSGTRLPGENICNSIDTEVYPILPDACSASSYIVAGTGYNWSITTNADCGGCRLICDVDKCTEVGDCNM